MPKASHQAPVLVLTELNTNQPIETMKTKLRLLTLAVSICFGTLLSSCETAGTSTAGTDAVMCDKCKTVWVKQNIGGGASGRSSMIFRDAKTMTCEDCTLAVNTFWKTGQIKHTCSHCGGTLTHCTAH
jgi:hypothetical protein